jgi:hypothetical protein
VQPMNSESDGVMEYALTGRLAYDATWTKAMSLVVVNSMTALP